MKGSFVEEKNITFKEFSATWLDLSDIDLVEHRISITKTYYNPTNNIKEYTLLTPNTKKSIRFIEIV
ncbi:hypothetical protein [Paenibacillus sp. IHBB 10380]|uniref:hypothetical protein n=1 Tax=Paenibacillus sp. IHBB 10380 TaxID=1566358 RepID=UPI0005CFA30C|nr:hypothetical protein [Paenibacillus sp. IHBB 10380]AJS59981.1 hypothetical protein UB51_17595 [Paenibacillus sp. IHBB 10380]